MKELLYNTLLSLGYPVFLKSRLPVPDDENYPESFICYLTVNSPDSSHYDNEVQSWEWQYQVDFYSADPFLVALVPDEIRTKLKAVGFIPVGKGRDLPSGLETHTGWTCDYLYREIRRIKK